MVHKLSHKSLSHKVFKDARHKTSIAVVECHHQPQIMSAWSSGTRASPSITNNEGCLIQENYSKSLYPQLHLQLLIAFHRQNLSIAHSGVWLVYNQDTWIIQRWNIIPWPYIIPMWHKVMGYCPIWIYCSWCSRPICFMTQGWISKSHSCSIDSSL